MNTIQQKSPSKRSGAKAKEEHQRPEDSHGPQLETSDETTDRKRSEALILSGVKVLVIDDQEDAQELFTFALEQYSADVRVCSSAREGFDQILIWKPDVIVSDIGLPGENGYELMEKIRALDEEQGGKIPALALTGYASTVDQEKALAAGYQSHLAKPVGIEELAGVVAKLSGRESNVQE